MTAGTQEHTIDVVIAWVDGSDAAHRAKLDAHLAELGVRPETAEPTRFSSVGEIDYCVKSLLRFAPFVRRIHVVTDAQVPPLFEQLWQRDPALRERIACVDHRVIFAGHEDCLPTFNARTIESLLWRIPGLAEHFVYFNDDMILIKPITPDDWFRTGRPVLHGSYQVPIDREWRQRIKRALRRKLNRPKTPTPLHKRAEAMAAARLGFERKCFLSGHCPYPLRRSTFESYFAAHPLALRENIAHRLRSAAQFAPAALANHIEIRAQQACLEPDDRSLYAYPAAMTREQFGTMLTKADCSPRVVYACLQSLDLADASLRSDAFAWLARTID